MENLVEKLEDQLITKTEGTSDKNMECMKNKIEETKQKILNSNKSKEDTSKIKAHVNSKIENKSSKAYTNLELQRLYCPWLKAQANETNLQD